MKKLLFILIILVLTACGRVDKVDTQKHPIGEQPPSFFDMSVMEKVDWKESPIFMYDQTELRGVEEKVGILSVPWKAGTANKYMWFFFGENITSGEKLSVIAVKKGTNEISKAIYLSENKQSWSEGAYIPVAVNGETDIPSSMKLPSKGMWALNAYIGETFFGQIIVDVK